MKKFSLRRWWTTRTFRARRRGLLALGVVALIPLLTPRAANDCPRTGPFPAHGEDCAHADRPSDRETLRQLFTSESTGWSYSVWYRGPLPSQPRPWSLVVSTPSYSEPLEVQFDTEAERDAWLEWAQEQEAPWASVEPWRSPCGPSCTSLHLPGYCLTPPRQGYVFVSDPHEAEARRQAARLIRVVRSHDAVHGEACVQPGRPRTLSGHGVLGDCSCNYDAFFYGELTELSEDSLIDAVLHSGSK